MNYFNVTINVIIIFPETIFPPVFGRRLQAQVVKKGDRLVMEVEVTGTPEPTITWQKDNLPIESCLKTGYRTKTLGNCHTLIIEKGNKILHIMGMSLILTTPVILEHQK